MKTNNDCDCREKVNAKVDAGELRQALSRSSFIPSDAQDSLVQQACDRKSLRNRYVDNGELRNALNRAGWSENEIDFAFHRSQHEHEKE
jgi:hypothetical protein